MKFTSIFLQPAKVFSLFMPNIGKSELTHKVYFAILELSVSLQSVLSKDILTKHPLMDIRFHTIQDTSDCYWPMFLETYTQSFPINEQRPEESIIQLLSEEKRFRVMAIVDETYSFLGLLTCWTFVNFIYIEHFALSPTLRSHGYGSIALGTFIKQNNLPIVLEVELPTDEQAKRRIQFYQRRGLSLYDYNYIQPPYTPNRLSVPMRLMGTLSTDISLSHVTKTLHREVYNTQTKTSIPCTIKD